MWNIYEILKGDNKILVITLLQIKWNKGDTKILGKNGRFCKPLVYAFHLVYITIEVVSLQNVQDDEYVLCQTLSFGMFLVFFFWLSPGMLDFYFVKGGIN